MSYYCIEPAGGTSLKSDAIHLYYLSYSRKSPRKAASLPVFKLVSYICIGLQFQFAVSIEIKLTMINIVYCKNPQRRRMDLY